MLISLAPTLPVAGTYKYRMKSNEKQSEQPPVREVEEIKKLLIGSLFGSDERYPLKVKNHCPIKS